MDITSGAKLYIILLFGINCVFSGGDFNIEVKGDCDIYAECASGIENVDLSEFLKTEPCVHFQRRTSSGEYIFGANFNIYLTVDSISLDSNLAYFKRFNKNIKTITFKNVKTVPTTLKQYPNIEQIIFTDFLVDDLNLSDFLGITSSTKVIFAKNVIEVIEFNYNNNSVTSNVKAFDFSHNNIHSLPNNCFSKFNNLKNLNLSHNTISNFDIVTFEGLLELETLDISYNELYEIGHSFARFVNMIELKINNNNLTSILEPNFKSMVKLEKLNMSSNELQTIEEDSFKTLKELRVLDLSQNQLTKVARVLLQNNNKLHTFLIGNNKIERVESESFKEKNISTFDISNNSFIGVIEKQSFNGIETNSLNFSGYKITLLESEAFTGLNSNTLDLSNNVITTVAFSAFSLVKSLKQLDLSNNNLSSISFETSDLKQLITFCAKRNKINNISRSMINNFVSLKILDLSHNKITKLEPQLFSELKSLEHLDLSHNLIANDVAKSNFQGLFALNNLQLGWNRITTIKNETFSGLNKLEVINFTHSEITSIENEAFKDSGAILQLDLSFNLLQSLSLNSSSLSSTRELYINNNEIRSITKETCSGLSNIKTIYLSHNNLIRLERNFLTSAINLSVLDISSNAELDIDSIVQNVNACTELKLGNIKKQFSFEKVANKSVSYLDLSFDDIANINSIFVYKFENILRLNLNSNKITFIDKLSFQNMDALTWLDMSNNQITNIQPGSFIHTGGIRYLNLFGNSLTSLQFGVFDTLRRLETLNLSYNALHEFSASLLPKNAIALSMLALDSNNIENINIKQFVNRNIKVISIGDNPISCHNLLVVIDYLTTTKESLLLTAERIDYHSENVQGIQCASLPNNSLRLHTSYKNSTESLPNVTYQLQSLKESIDKLKLAIDVFANGSLVQSKENSKTQMMNLTSLKTYGNVTGTSLENSKLSENVEFVNDEKQNAGKEMHEINEMKTQREAQTLYYDNDTYFRGAIYLMTFCLCSLTIMISTKSVFRFWKSRNIYRNNTLSCGNSIQPIANVIELS